MRRIINLSLALVISLLLALPSNAQVVRRSASTSTTTSKTTSSTTSTASTSSRQEEPKSASASQVVRRASDVASNAKSNQVNRSQNTQQSTQKSTQQGTSVLRRTSGSYTTSQKESAQNPTTQSQSSSTTQSGTRVIRRTSSTATTTTGSATTGSTSASTSRSTTSTTAGTSTPSYQYDVARGGLIHTTQPQQAGRAYTQKVNREAYGLPRYNVRPAHNGGYVMPIVHTAPIAIPPRHLHDSYCYGKYFTSLPAAMETVVFGGINYYYCQGLYYRYIQKRYVIVRPPVGALLNAAYFNSVQAITFALADALITSAIVNTGKKIVINGVNYGTEVLTYDDVNYFYEDGVFFVVDANGNYVVVEPPIGALVRTLPSDRQTVKYNGISMYKVGDTVFRKVYVGGVLHYEVVGTLYVD